MMSSPIEISDDDESFDQPFHTKDDLVALSSDEKGDSTENNVTSDDDSPLPALKLKNTRSSVIKNLFPNTNLKEKPRKIGQSVPAPLPPKPPQRPIEPGFSKMIEGVNVLLPVNPYGSQVALISKVITAIKRGENCLLESPTGSGKTLALLCGALAWQQCERNRQAQTQVSQYFVDHPQLNGVKGAAEYIASPYKTNVTPEKLFSKTTFGEKSIYDKPAQNGSVAGSSSTSNKRQEPLRDSPEDSIKCGEVNIHKKRRCDSSCESTKANSPNNPSTPEKNINTEQAETPQSVRNLYNLVQNLQLRTSMLVHSSVPTIYYGARTHKQIQQVIKEFRRTAYCGDALMSVLSSREYSCIREFDKQLWGTKNDMCRGCVKSHTVEKEKKGETNCKYYNNRQALCHERLPPAFDLEDLVRAGEELSACPYYAARGMANSAQIVFCPYNYLIEPGIRSNMQIDLTDNIVIIDEGHNIEDICRDAATCTITRDQIQATLKELETLAEYRYANSNQDILNYVDNLIKTLKSWNDWFANQTPLVNNQPVNSFEAVYTWQVEHFVNTLNNHNIGQPHFNDFKQNAEIFCRRLREDPRTLYGISQATGTLLETVETVLGYLFRSNGQYMDDFKPALIRNVYGSESMSNAISWRNSQFNKSIEKESLSLRLMCMNPAVVFEGLKSAKCIILSSGTLAPLVSLHSELGTEFRLKVSPNHIIPQDRVWIGSLTTCPDGSRLECKSRATDQPSVQDALGQTILWVCQVTPHGVLCFLSSYMLMNKLVNRWRQNGVWEQLNKLKHVFQESRNVKDHNDVMEDYYKYATTDKGALLFAVYRGKVSEGMDFKDHQARAVITVGVPYPNTYDMAVRAKMEYNNKYSRQRNLLSGDEWLRVQAYRALNQAVGRCVRHRGDWGAVLMVDARFANSHYTEHLSKWVRNFLGNNHHTFQSLVNSDNSLESFMQTMKIRENEDNT